MSGCRCVTVTPAAPVRLSVSLPAAALCHRHCLTCRSPTSLAMGFARPELRGSKFSFFFQTPAHPVITPFSISSFSSGLFIPPGNFKYHSALRCYVNSTCYSNLATLFPGIHDFSPLKIRRSLLKERIKHLFYLMASTVDMEEHHYLRSVMSRIHH